MDQQPALRASFTRTILPWLIAAGAFLLYLVTLNHWTSLASLPLISRISGYLWTPELSAPLHFLVTYPLRWLPPTATPIAFNLFSAVCAALILALLARCVTLLPHDRTHEQRLREKSEHSLLTIRAAWLPPVLAVFVCGLQLTFWEHATVASTDIFDLLLFAYVIRCLLEFRVDGRQTWLSRAAFIYGLGMTNNWAMIGFFPLFLTALVWIKGLQFFNVSFLGRMALWGCAGLLLYFLLPIVQSFANVAPVPFWEALKNNLGGQKTMLSALYTNARQLILLLSLTSILPIFVIGIRWASSFGDTSRLGIILATFTFHVVHILFLLACIWVAMDPPLSPRNKGYGLPFLTFYYLGALSVGYFSGYFLLIFGSRLDRFRRSSPASRFINHAITTSIWALLFIVPLGLVARNLHQIRVTNHDALKQYATLLLNGLPSQKTFVLSDDLRALSLLEMRTADARVHNNYVFIDTSSLKWPQYHRFLSNRYPGAWSAHFPKDVQIVGDNALLNAISSIVETNPVYYLQPSFGYYFERFYMDPHGLVYQLKPYQTNSLLRPQLEKSVIDDNQRFWAKADDTVVPHLLRVIDPAKQTPQPAWIKTLVARTHLSNETNREAALLGRMYSKARNFWGVQLQRSGDFSAAGPHFERALELNPENIVARVNLDCNAAVQAGRTNTVRPSNAIEDFFGKHRKWDEVLMANGPFDDASFCFEQGRVFAGSSLYRQAAAEFDRVATFVPDNIPSRLWVAQLYVVLHAPDQALKIVNHIHANAELFNLGRTNQNDLLYVESAAYLSKGEVAKAEQAVNAVLAKYPKSFDLLGNVAHAYITYGAWSNALSTLEEQLQISPDEPSTMINQGFVLMQIGRYKEAVPVLTKALELDTNNVSALLNRAIANLMADQLDASQRDYEALEKLAPTAFQVYYGLQDIALRKNDTNSAMRYCEIYLTHAPPNTPEAKLIADRLQMLRSGSASQVYFQLQEGAFTDKKTNAAIRFCELYLAHSQPGNEQSKLITERLQQLKSGPP
jgi:tetratricopeptide (TPR) repeat protein